MRLQLLGGRVKDQPALIRSGLCPGRGETHGSAPEADFQERVPEDHLGRLWECASWEPRAPASRLVEAPFPSVRSAPAFGLFTVGGMRRHMPSSGGSLGAPHCGRWESGSSALRTRASPPAGVGPERFWQVWGRASRQSVPPSASLSCSPSGQVLSYHVLPTEPPGGPAKVAACDSICPVLSAAIGKVLLAWRVTSLGRSLPRRLLWTSRQGPDLPGGTSFFPSQ